MSAALTQAVVLLTGFTCKAVFRLGLCSVHVTGIEHIAKALDDRRGVITVSNHISTLDDPLSWAVLPTSYLFDPSRRIRWSLGASDVMFTNPLFSTFFRHGQTIETFRGKGIYQRAVDLAISKLKQDRSWIHFYSEGKINQPNVTPYYHENEEARVPHLPRFKWGIGRVIMNSFDLEHQPPVIPIFLTGFDKVMPEGRRFPWKYLPRFGARLSVTFGRPIPPEKLLTTLRTGENCDASLLEPSRPWPLDIENSNIPQVKEEIERLRIEVTQVIQDEVESLGRRALVAAQKIS
ncbi:acyltransferase-domain-containing protein [Flagelloscypha sp. PMI_526]|nr:acyltransferase-domain-containing protein [Flagelloscypha sp. PMI_526]